MLAGRGVAQVLLGMLTCSVLATLYFAHLGIEGEWVGNML
jgi:hypothetical protein